MRILVHRCALAWLAVLPCTTLSCKPSPPPNVLLVVVDTLRADRLGCYGSGAGLTPFLDELARRGTVFRNAYAPSSWTTPSIASLFTSRYPLEHRVNSTDALLDEREITLAERFLAAGYWTAAYEGNFSVSDKRGYGQGFKSWFAQTPGAGKPPGSRLRSRALSRAQATCGRGRRQSCLLYLQYMEPHAPYEPPELAAAPTDPATLAAAAANAQLRANQGEVTDEQVKVLASLYDGEVAAVDAELRALFQGLEERGFLSDAVVVVTADHGEEFREHGWMSHGTGLNNEIVRVPLIIVAPGYEKGRVVEENVSSLDVAPTLLDLAGLPPEPRFRGRSLAPLMGRSWAAGGSGWFASAFGKQTGRGPDVVFELARTGGGFDLRRHTAGIVRGRLKLIETINNQTELYDLAADPGETTPNPPGLAAERSALATALQAATSAHADAAASGDNKVQLDEKTKQHLRALGYADF